MAGLKATGSPLASASKALEEEELTLGSLNGD